MNILEINTLFESLYKDLDGWKISDQNFHKLDHVNASYLYDEASVDSFYNALQIAGATKQDSFIDLGSGLGKKTLAAAMLFPLQSYGIEILHDMVTVSESVLNALQVDHSEITNRIHFVEGDYYAYDFSFASLIHISISPEMLRFQLDGTLGEKLRALHIGTRIIVSEVPITFSEFKCLDVIEYVFPTRKEKAYIYKKTL